MLQSIYHLKDTILSPCWVDEYLQQASHLMYLNIFNWGQKSDIAPQSLEIWNANVPTLSQEVKEYVSSYLSTSTWKHVILESWSSSGGFVVARVEHHMTSIQSNVFEDIQVQTESQYLSLVPKRSPPEMKCKSGWYKWERKRIQQIAELCIDFFDGKNCSPNDYALWNVF